MTIKGALLSQYMNVHVLHKGIVVTKLLGSY